MKDLVLHDKVHKIYTILRLAKNNNFEYVLEDESAKRLTESIMEHIRTFNMNDHNNKEYIQKVKDSLNVL